MIPGKQSPNQRPRKHVSDFPIVSIVMSVYNSQRYLCSAVESILAQTFSNFEFIVINDGSTDRSLKILRDFQKQDHRIRVISRDRTGLTPALNEGIRLAKGHFIARMDADDVAYPQRFEQQVHFLNKYPACVAVGCALLLIDPDGEAIAERHPLVPHDSIVLSLLSGNTAIPHPSAMIRREALVSVGAYREDFEYAQDLDLWLRLCETGELANLGKILMQYRLHEQSITAKHLTRQAECAERAVRDAYQRRQLSIPTNFRMPVRKIVSRDHTLRRWAKLALRSGNLEVAKKHAWAAFSTSPLSLGNVRLAARFLSYRSKTTAGSWFTSSF